MLVWMQTVTDRSQSDVDRVLELLQKGWDNFNVDEKTEWLAGMKGAQSVAQFIVDSSFAPTIEKEYAQKILVAIV